MINRFAEDMSCLQDFGKPRGMNSGTIFYSQNNLEAAIGEASICLSASVTPEGV